MVHVRILATYPPAFGLPEESFDFTFQLRPEFAQTAYGASARMGGALARGEDLALQVVDEAEPVRFSADVVRSFVVW